MSIVEGLAPVYYYNMELPQNSNKVKINRKAFIKKSLSLLVIIGLLTIVIWNHTSQRQTISDLEAKSARQISEQKEIKTKNTELASNNTNLTKAVKTLQSQIDSSKIIDSAIEKAPLGSENNSEPQKPKPAGSISVTGVRHDPTFSPANGTTPRASYDHIGVHITIKNLSESNQNYSLGDFSAVTDTGLVVKPISFGPWIEETIWYRSELVPQGYQDILIYFDLGQNLVALNWDVPGGDGSIDISLPPIEE